MVVIVKLTHDWELLRVCYSQERWLYMYMLVVHLQWAGMLQCPFRGRVRFYQAGASEGGRADRINGDALDAEDCPQMVISFRSQQHTDCYGN